MKLRPVEQVLRDITLGANMERATALLRADRRATIEAAKKIVRKRIRQSQDAITGRMLGDHPTLDPACVPDVVCRDLDSLLDALLDEAEATEEHDA